MEYEYLVKKVEKFDLWENSNRKTLDLMYISMLCTLWEKMDKSHKFYPDPNPNKNQVRFGLLRCGIPPMTEMSDQFYTIMGGNSRRGLLDPDIQEIENRWKKILPPHQRKIQKRIKYKYV